MIAKTTMSLGRSQPCQVCHTAMPRPRNGTAVTKPVMIRSRVSCSVTWMSAGPGAGLADSAVTVYRTLQPGRGLGHANLVEGDPERASHARVRSVLVQCGQHVVHVEL